MALSRRLRVPLLAIAGAFVLIQLVPYGRSHTDPPVTMEPKWDSALTRSLAQGSCFDCHSNQTTWPLYSDVAPISWWVQQHVDSGRSALNFSAWDKPQDGADSVAEVINDGSMPPWYYTAFHWSARLSASEKAELIAGLRATYANSPPIAGGG